MLQTRVDSIQKDIAVIFNDLLSPQARSRDFARIAGGYIDEADANNRRILGYAPMRRVFVDGREGAQLTSVKPDGTIAAEWETSSDFIQRVGELLRQYSPVLTGRYRRDHVLFADGQAVPVGASVPKANEYIYVNLSPYARKIEGTESRPPLSRKAPDGVYQLVVKQARGIARQMGVRDVKITYAFRSVSGVSRGRRARNERNPAIIIRYR